MFFTWHLYSIMPIMIPRYLAGDSFFLLPRSLFVQRSHLYLSPRYWPCSYLLNHSDISSDSVKKHSTTNQYWGVILSFHHLGPGDELCFQTTASTFSCKAISLVSPFGTVNKATAAAEVMRRSMLSTSCK